MTLFQRKDGKEKNRESEAERDRWIEGNVYRKSSNVVEKRKERDRGGKDRRRGEDECEVGDGGTPDCRHRLLGDYVPQTDAPAGPDRHH